jgi:hypothetical protein
MDQEKSAAKDQGVQSGVDEKGVQEPRATSALEAEGVEQGDQEDMEKDRPLLGLQDLEQGRKERRLGLGAP